MKKEHESLLEHFIWALVFGVIAGVFGRMASPSGQLTMGVVILVAICSVVFGIARGKRLGVDLFMMLVIAVGIFKYIAPLIIKGTGLSQLP